MVFVAMSANNGAIQAGPALTEAARRVLQEHGQFGAAQLTGVSRFVLTKIAAGLPVWPATVTDAALKLGVLAPEPSGCLDWRDRPDIDTKGMPQNSKKRAARGVPAWMLALSMAFNAGSPLWTEHHHDRTLVEIAEAQTQATIRAADSAAAAAVKVGEIAAKAAIRVAEMNRDTEKVRH